VTALVGIANILVAQAHGGGGDGLWDPKLKGYVVVISAVGLFCGSVYLLLWTNVGSSIGFLVSGAAVAGIVLMMSTLWVTGQFPNGYLGRLPKWNVTQILTASEGVQASDVGKVRNIANGNVPEASQAIAGQIKADLDAEIAGETADPDNKLFTNADAYKAVRTYRVGGERKMPIWWSTKPEHAAVEICTLTVKPATYDELNNPPFIPDCDPTVANRIVVLHHDLGSLRLPAAYTMAGSAVLLAGFLYGLYLVELRQRQAAAAPPESTVPATT
jgi:hypothetical protein